MSTNMAQNTSFIDQLLAGQLFAAARAHDSLSEEVSNFLPASISEIFPHDDNHSLKYKISSYSALAKSQQQDSVDSDDSVTNDVKGNIVLHVLRDALLQKCITNYLSMNDKLSLIFAVSDENEEDLDEDDEEEESEKDSRVAASAKGVSLSEDLFHRESEDLEMQRSQFLTHLVQTRDIESKMQTLKQKLDRSSCILGDPNSADLIRLNYMANKLFLLRDISSKKYEDYFSARGNYSAWSVEHQSHYMTRTNRALDRVRVAAEANLTNHEESVQKCRQFMSDVISGDDIITGNRNSGNSYPKKRGMSTQFMKGKSGRRTSVVFSTPEGVSLRPVEEVSEFKEMRNRGLSHLVPYQAQEESRDVSFSDTSCDHDIPHDISWKKECTLLNGDSLVKYNEETGGCEQDTATDLGVSPEFYLDSEDLDNYRQRLALSLKEFDMELCERLENMSKLSFANVKKKFVNLEPNHELPTYLKDIKWKIDQKKKMVMVGTTQLEATKESMATDFEERIEKSYRYFYEQQMTKLKRIQSYCHVEGSI